MTTTIIFRPIKGAPLQTATVNLETGKIRGFDTDTFKVLLIGLEVPVAEPKEISEDVIYHMLLKLYSDSQLLWAVYFNDNEYIYGLEEEDTSVISLVQCSTDVVRYLDLSRITFDIMLPNPETFKIIGYSRTFFDLMHYHLPTVIETIHLDVLRKRIYIENRVYTIGESCLSKIAYIDWNQELPSNYGILAQQQQKIIGLVYCKDMTYRLLGAEGATAFLVLN